MSLLKIVTRAFEEVRGPSVLFFEGAPTNGDYILNCDHKLIDEIGTMQNKFQRSNMIICFKYEEYGLFKIASPEHNINPLLEILRLMMNINNKIIVRCH